jgi:hypothetical protein
MPPQLRIDAHCCLSEKKTTQRNRVILTLRGITADTGIHNPMIIGFIDKILHYLRWQYHLVWHADWLVYLNHPVVGQIDYIVAIKKPVVNSFADYRHLGQSSKKKAARKTYFNEFYEPQWPAHGCTNL